MNEMELLRELAQADAAACACRAGRGPRQAGRRDRHGSGYVRHSRGTGHHGPALPRQPASRPGRCGLPLPRRC